VANSFAAGTLVVMADGDTKPISKIHPGDAVLAGPSNPANTESAAVKAAGAKSDVKAQRAATAQRAPRLPRRRLLTPRFSTPRLAMRRLLWHLSLRRWLRRRGK
jgi:hypothetical protein